MLSCRHALCRLTILQSRLPALTRYCSDDTNNSTTKTPTKLVDEWQRPTNTELALRDAGFHGVPNDEIGKKEYAIAQKAVESALIGPESKEDSDEKTPPLNADQKLLAQVKLKSWMRSFDEQWTEENRDMILEISQLEERLKHDPHNDEIKSQTALIYESRSQEEFHRHMVRKALPGIANRYALDSKKWDKREMEVLQSELQNEIESNQMKKYAMEWFKLNPLRTQSKDAMDRSGIAPIPVRLQTLLEHIDPRLKQMNKEIGVKDDVEPSEHEMIDLSDPARVCEVLLNHGYRFNPDGSFANVNREPFALDASQRTLLRDGVNEHGDHLSGGALTQAIKKTLQLSSSSLRFKLFGMRNWAIQESRRTHSPELSTEQLLENPDLLPEKLRPTLEDLDPDAVPPPQTFSPVLDKCPLCNRPKTGVKKPCHFPPSSLVLSYTNIELLNQFVNEFGMIIPRRESGVCAKYQRKVAKAIKRAREMSLMPYNTRLVLGDRIDHQNPDMIRVAERMDVLSSSHKSSRSRYRNNRF